MKDGVPNNGSDEEDGRRARLDELYEHLTVLVLRRRELDAETQKIWEEIHQLENDG